MDGLSVIAPLVYDELSVDVHPNPIVGTRGKAVRTRGKVDAPCPFGNEMIDVDRRVRGTPAPIKINRRVKA